MVEVKARLISETKYRLHLLAVETIGAICVTAVIGAASALLPKKRDAVTTGRKPTTQKGTE